MTKTNWIAGAAIVFVVLALALTLDPLGFFDEPLDEDSETSYVGDDLGAPGLSGGGKKPLPDQDPKVWEGDPVGVLFLQLGKATLKGSVIAESGPLRFARVRPVLAPPNEGVAVRTRKDGTFEIRGLPDGAHELRASMAAYTPRTVTAPPVLGEQTVSVPPIELELRRARTDAISVRVTDLFGRPLPGAKVLATTLAWDLHLAIGPELNGMSGVLHASGRTDENGRVRLGPLQPASYNVIAQLEGYIATPVNNVVVSGGRVRHIGLQMGESVSISGHVQDPDGEPVEGAVVMGFATPSFVSSPSVRTGPDGSFVLDGLRRSTYMVIAASDSHGEVQTSTEAPDRGVALKLKGAGTIKGVVTWADGKPVPGGTVRPFGAGPFRYVYSVVYPIDEEGRFEVRVPTGDWLLRAQSREGHLAPDFAVKVQAGEAQDVKIKMPRTGIVRGVIMDAEGRHIPDAEIFIMKGGMPETPSREQYARSSGEGEFEVAGLPLETTFLHVRHPEYRDEKLEFMPSPAASAKEVSVRLERGARIVGRVVDAAGNGLAGEQVNVVLSWFDTLTTFTDVEGRFAFESVTPGSYDMTTGPYEANARGLRKSGIKVGDAGEVAVEFVVPEAAGHLTGEVQQGGEPVAGAEVTIQDARGPDHAVRVRTDETGRFAAEGLQFGRVRVEARTPDGLRADAGANVVEGDTPTHVVISIGSATVRGRAVDENGEPVSGAWINVELVDTEDQGWRQVKANGNTDSNGVFEARGLEPGRYRMRLNTPAFAQYLSKAVDVAAGGTADIGNMPMSRGVQISGQVKDDAGRPLEKVTVALEDMNGRPVFLFSIATTGSDGRYTLRGVEAGRYTLRFECAGHGPQKQAADCTAGNVEKDGVLTRGGSVQVAVEDEAGRPLAGVRVRLFDASGNQVTRTISLANFDTGRRTTGADGKTQLSDLAGGTYEVRCEKNGFIALDKPRAFVEPGGTATVRVVMQASE